MLCQMLHPRLSYPLPRNELPQDLQLKTTHIYCLTVPVGPGTILLGPLAPRSPQSYLKTPREGPTFKLTHTVVKRSPFLMEPS